MVEQVFINRRQYEIRWEDYGAVKSGYVEWHDSKGMQWLHFMTKGTDLMLEYKVNLAKSSFAKLEETILELLNP